MALQFNRVIIFLSLLSPVAGFSQKAFDAKSVGKQEVPAQVSFKGNFVKAFSWTDKLGKNLVVFSESGIDSKYDKEAEMDIKNGELYAAHFLITGGSATQSWKMLDFEKNCPFDIRVAFKEDAFQITDLDKDGTAEVWMLYRTACRSDVSPLNMKIIMYEGKQKYAMRGQTKVQISEHDYFGGNYTADEAFKKAPAAFQQFGDALWKKYVMPD